MIEKTEKEIIENWKGNISNPVVSICCITYNHEKYISEAIDSFLMQETDFPFEIIIGEDCSTDGTRKVVDEYLKKYPNIITLITSENNVGASKNSERTLIACKGEYIAICDGDDYWITHDKIASQVLFLNNNESYVLTYSKALISFNNQKVKSSLTVGFPFAESEFYYKNNIATLTAMFRKKCLNGYYEEIKEMQKEWLQADYPLWLWLYSKGNIHFENRVTAIYRVLDFSTSRPNGLEKQYKFKVSYLSVVKYFSSKNTNNELKNKALSKSNFNVGIWCLKRSLKYSFFHLNQSIYYSKSIDKLFLIIFFNRYMVNLYLKIMLIKKIFYKKNKE